MKFAIYLTLFFASVVLGQNIKVPTKGDIRNEFDHLLVETAYHILQTSEQHLLKLQQDIDKLNVSKSKAEQDQIIQDIQVSISFTEGAQGTLTRELARTDLNVVERFTFEEGQAIGAILIKDLKEAEVKVRAVKTV